MSQQWIWSVKTLIFPSVRFAACDCRGSQVSENRVFCANLLHAFPPFPLQVGLFQGHSGVLVADLAVLSQGSCYPSASLRSHYYIHSLSSPPAPCNTVLCLQGLFRPQPLLLLIWFFSCISLNSCKALGVSPEAPFSTSSSECLNYLIQPMVVSLCLYTLRIRTLMTATLAYPLPHTPTFAEHTDMSRSWTSYGSLISKPSFVPSPR